MPFRQITRIVLQCVLLCLVKLSYSDLQKENPETSAFSFSNSNPTLKIQPGIIDSGNPDIWNSGVDDNGKPMSIPPGLSGLCPTGPHDLEPCECIEMGAKNAGQISIQCDASTNWTSVGEMKEMFSSVDIYPTTTVFRFSMTRTNVAGTLNEFVWGPLIFRQIILDNNKIQVIDNHAFSGSSGNLTVLSLKYNEIIYFHWDHLQELPNLYSLILQGNQLTFIPSNVFPATEIAYLDLSKNQFQYIGPNAFDKLHKLRKLDLAHNMLESLDDNMFSISGHNPTEFNDLQIILSNNFIQHISPNAFVNVHPVVLDLSNNYLTTLDEEVFWPLIQGNNQFIYINVEGNQIWCDCGIAWIGLENINIFSTFECYDEYGPTGTYFDELEDSYFDDCYEPFEDED